MIPAQATLSFESGIQQRFEQFHAEHPEVYACLIRFARQVKGRGFAHYGIRPLWEQVRWHFQIERGDEDFKLNDAFPSRYARKLMAENEDLQGFFEIRRLKSQ